MLSGEDFDMSDVEESLTDSEDVSGDISNVLDKLENTKLFTNPTEEEKVNNFNTILKNIKIIEDVSVNISFQEMIELYRYIHNYNKMYIYFLSHGEEEISLQGVQILSLLQPWESDLSEEQIKENFWKWILDTQASYTIIVNTVSQ